MNLRKTKMPGKIGGIEGQLIVALSCDNVENMNGGVANKTNVGLEEFSNFKLFPTAFFEI